MCIYIYIYISYIFIYIIIAITNLIKSSYSVCA